VAKDALQSYIMLNVLFCKPELWEGGKDDYKDIATYKTTFEDLVQGHGNDASKLPHRAFFGQPFYPDPYAEQPDGPIFDPRGNYMTDLDRLSSYLKKCFEVMVTYEVVMREGGAELNWEQEIKHILVWQCFRFKTRPGIDWEHFEFA
jgi:hypothetical protein